MKLETFRNADAFLRTAEPVFLANEALTSLILGIAIRLRDGHTFGDEPPFLSCVLDEDRVVAIATRTPPHNLLIHAVESDGEPLDLVANHLGGAGVTLRGVHGRSEEAERFAEAWTRVTAAAREISMEQRLYKLTEVSAPDGVPGRLRPAAEREHDLLVRWVKAFVDEAIGAAPHPDPSGLVERLTQAGALFVWDHGEPVSMASSNRPTPNGIAVNLVYTPPEKRGRGYATACVASVSQGQLDRGKTFCTLFADLANPTSNAVYKRVGYRPVADFSEILFS